MKTEYKVYYQGRTYSGEGIYDSKDNSLTVLEGSKITREETTSFRRFYLKPAKIKDELLEKEIIVDYEFIQDYKFENPFQASSILSSYGQTGDDAWKTIDGKTIRKIKEIHENIEYFKEYSKNYNRSIDLEKIESVVQDFNEKFPLEDLPNLPIEEYDKQGSRDSLAYMIEHGTDEIFSGFLGSNKNKIIYQLKNGEYVSVEFLSNQYPDKSVMEVYDLYRKSLYLFIKEFDRENYISDRVDALPKNTNVIRTKLLNLYHYGELLHIGSKNWFTDIFNYFGLETKNMDAVMMNLKLQKFMQEIGVEIDTVSLSYVIGSFYNDVIKGEEKPPEKNFDDLFLEDSYIKEIIRVLKRKKAIILKGVPGVGKTFVIQDMIRKSFDHIAKEGIETIQFHQSYSYEEFVEGLRPQMSGGFEIEEGVFYDIAERARGNPEENYFLVIDEINRGNLSKIFGELLMLIENDKRDDTYVRLPYSKESFNVPGNLYIIGTMNTADRSLALVDYAMRRRFSFITLEPAYHTEKFSNFLVRKMGLENTFVSELQERMIKVNQIIENRLGEDFLIGHSYFVANDDELSDVNTWYREIVKYEIMPMIEEYFFDDLDTIEELRIILSEEI